MSSVFVARHPIYKSNLDTFAYELLFRSSLDNKAEVTDEDQATATLIMNTFAEIGINRLAGIHPVFVNVGERFLLDGHAQVLPTERVVLEILEDVRPTKEILQSIADLRDHGYTIAIDDFVYSDDLLPLVDLADIVKVELPALTPSQLGMHADILRNRGVRLLAEKVETREEFELCRSMGFDYYQGYFFCKPTIVSGTKLSIDQLTLLRLIGKLQQPGIHLGEIADIVRTEPALTYKLLRFVNSSFSSTQQKIESIQHAVTIAGLARIRSLACISVLTDGDHPLAPQLVPTILLRARMCELLAEKVNASNTESYFLMGLFSALDALLNIPIAEAIELVPVNHEVKQAILNRKGVAGNVLECVLDYEQGNWSSVAQSSINSDLIRDAYLEAIHWTETTIDDSRESAPKPDGSDSDESNQGEMLV